MITDYDKAQLTNFIANNVKCQPAEAALIVRHIDHYFESASRIATLEAEVGRLNGLIEKAYTWGRNRGNSKSEEWHTRSWNNFKSTHNL